MSKTFNVYCFDVTICSHSQLLIIWGKRAREQDALYKCIHNPHFSKELQLPQEIIYQRIIKHTRVSVPFTSLTCLLVEMPRSSEMAGREKILKNLQMVNPSLNQELTELYNLTKVLRTRQYLYMCIYNIYSKYSVRNTCHVFLQILWLSDCCSIMLCDFPM